MSISELYESQKAIALSEFKEIITDSCLLYTSIPPVARVVPSPEKATAVTAPRCAGILGKGVLPDTGHTRILPTAVPSSSPTTNSCPSGAKARLSGLAGAMFHGRREPSAIDHRSTEPPSHTEASVAPSGLKATLRTAPGPSS